MEIKRFKDSMFFLLGFYLALVGPNLFCAPSLPFGKGMITLWHFTLELTTWFDFYRDSQLRVCHESQKELELELFKSNRTGETLKKRLLSLWLHVIVVHCVRQNCEPFIILIGSPSMNLARGKMWNLEFQQD